MLQPFAPYMHSLVFLFQFYSLFKTLTSTPFFNEDHQPILRLFRQGSLVNYSLSIVRLWRNTTWNRRRAESGSTPAPGVGESH